MGTNPVNPITGVEIKAQTQEKYGSPMKQARVVGYMKSSGMSQSLTNEGNDPSYGLVTAKGVNKGHGGPDGLKKEVWAPKITTQWV